MNSRGKLERAVAVAHWLWGPDQHHRAVFQTGREGPGQASRPDLSRARSRPRILRFEEAVIWFSLGTPRSFSALSVPIIARNVCSLCCIFRGLTLTLQDYP